LGWAFNQTTHNTWVVGVLDFTPGNTDNTNTLHLQNSLLYGYFNSFDVFKCPADRSMAYGPWGHKHRVRSLSMNNSLGRYDESVQGWPGDEDYLVRRKYGDWVNPSPANTFVLIDEREDSIDDCVFYVVQARGVAARIMNYPASYHNGAGGLSFADGHAEIRKWTDSRTTPILKRGVPLLPNVPSPHNQDVAWLQERTTSKR